MSMPTETITRCTTCHRRACDGGIWRRIDAIDKDFGHDILSQELRSLHLCSYHYGKKVFEKLRGKKVGDEVIIDLPGCTLKVRKAEE